MGNSGVRQEYGGPAVEDAPQITERPATPVRAASKPPSRPEEPSEHVSSIAPARPDSPKPVAPVLDGVVAVACPCCGSVLQVSTNSGTVINSIPSAAYLSQGIVPPTFFNSPYNTQGWIKKHPRAKRELGIK